MSRESEAASRGAAFLDGAMPGWWLRLDLDALDLGDGCACVLGQLFVKDPMIHDTGYIAGYEALALTSETAVFYGFDVEEAAHMLYARLTRCWRAEATRRVATLPPRPPENVALRR